MPNDRVTPFFVNHNHTYSNESFMPSELPEDHSCFDMTDQALAVRKRMHANACMHGDFHVDRPTTTSSPPKEFMQMSSPAEEIYSRSLADTSTGWDIETPPSGLYACVCHSQAYQEHRQPNEIDLEICAGQTNAAAGYSNAIPEPYVMADRHIYSQPSQLKMHDCDQRRMEVPISQTVKRGILYSKRNEQQARASSFPKFTAQSYEVSATTIMQSGHSSFSAQEPTRTTAISYDQNCLNESGTHDWKLPMSQTLPGTHGIITATSSTVPIDVDLSPQHIKHEVQHARTRLVAIDYVHWQFTNLCEVQLGAVPMVLRNLPSVTKRSHPELAPVIALQIMSPIFCRVRSKVVEKFLRAYIEKELASDMCVSNTIRRRRRTPARHRDAKNLIVVKMRD